MTLFAYISANIALNLSSSTLKISDMLQHYHILVYRIERNLLQQFFKSIDIWNLPQKKNYPPYFLFRQ